MKFVGVILILLVSSVISFRLIDIQNDAYEIEENSDIEETEESVVMLTEELENTRADLFDMVESKKDNKMPDLLSSIQKKIAELESSNNQLKQELTKTQSELSRRAEPIKRRKIAYVQLEKYNPNEQKESNDFWTWICRISKHVVAGIMNFFGVKF